MDKDPTFIEFMKASRSGNIEVLSSILDKNPNLLDTPDRDKCTALFHAIGNGHKEAARWLIGKGAAVKGIKNDEEKPLLFEAIAASSPVDLVSLLVQKGADFNEKFEKKGVISECVEWENLDLLNFFIHLGADVNQTVKKKNTPLHVAALKGNTNLVSLLIKKGANKESINKNSSTPLHLAVSSGSVSTVSTLIQQRANKEALNQDQWTPLHVVAYLSPNSAIALALLQSGVNMDVLSTSGKTPLHYACEKNHTNIVELLVQHGAKQNIVDKRGKTPADLASVTTKKLLL